MLLRDAPAAALVGRQASKEERICRRGVWHQRGTAASIEVLQSGEVGHRQELQVVGEHFDGPRAAALHPTFVGGPVDVRHEDRRIEPTKRRRLRLRRCGCSRRGCWAPITALGRQEPGFRRHGRRWRGSRRRCRAAIAASCRQECRSGRGSGSRRRGRANRAAVAACSAAKAAGVSAAVSWWAEVWASGAAEIHHDDDGRVAQWRLHGADIDDLLVGDGGCRRRSVAFLDCGELRREVSRRNRRSQPGRRRIEEEAASSLLLLRRRTAVDAEVEVEVDESAATAATTFDWSSAGQLPTSAASSSLPSAVSTSAMLVADDGTEEAGVEAMMSGDERRRRKEAKSDGAGKAAVRRKHVTPHMHACATQQLRSSSRCQEI